MKKLLTGLFAVLLVCTTLSSVTFASESTVEDDYGIAIASELEDPKDLAPHKQH